MHKTAIQLIVGLGNPGLEYKNTRHNAGVWFVEALVKKFNLHLRPELKFKGFCAHTTAHETPCHLFIPNAYMNVSGLPIQTIAKFYKIPPGAILIAHDELDLPTGTSRLKFDGGHGGHNGLRDTIHHLGTNAFYRLRIGIGHPGHKNDVLDYVLDRPSKMDLNKIHDAIEQSTQITDYLLTGEIQKAMKELHSLA